MWHILKINNNLLLSLPDIYFLLDNEFTLYFVAEYCHFVHVNQICVSQSPVLIFLSKIRSNFPLSLGHIYFVFPPGHNRVLTVSTSRWFLFPIFPVYKLYISHPPRCENLVISSFISSSSNYSMYSINNPAS